MACDALACGGDRLCGEHLRHWHRASRPAGAAFEAWRERVGEPLPASRYVDLSSLGDALRWEFLLGLSVAIDGHRRTRISELRRVVSLIAQRKVASLAELDVSGVRTDGVRLFVSWAQDRLRLAFADPDSEWRKDVWDMRVFGKPQAYRIDFTQITQPWLRELAKQWAREHAPLAHAASTRRVVASIGELSRSLGRRDDHGLDPTALGREDIALFLARISRAHSAGRVSMHKRSVLAADVSYVLRQARDLELGAEGRPVFGLPASFTLSREEVRRVARVPAPPPARALPDTVVAQLLAPDALGLLEAMHGQRVRIAVELLADTGRRPNEICILAWDCLDHDEQVDEGGQTRKLPILVHDMPKVARTGCRLPIDEQTAELITAQKRRIRERYPDTPIGELRLFPRLQRNPRGAAPMASMELSRVVRRWVTALPALLDSDGEPFDRARVVPYAFRHSYAQRHADNGTPVEVLRELMGHRSMATTQGYFKVRDERARQAVETARTVADRPPRQPHDATRRAARPERAAAPPGRPDRRAAGAVHRAIERQGARARLRLPLPLRRLRALPHRSLKPGRASRIPAPAARRPRTARGGDPAAGRLGAPRRHPQRRGDRRVAAADPSQRADHRRARSRRPRRGARRDRHHAPPARPAGGHDPRSLQGRHAPRAPDAASATGPVDMTPRGQAMVASRRLDSQLKRERVATAVDALAAAGRDSASPRSPATPASRASSSTPTRICAPRSSSAHSKLSPARSARAVADGRVTVASLQADLANAKAHNHRLRQQLRALEQRLSEALGRDIADQLDPSAERPEELRGQLHDAQAEIFEFREQLADAREELDAVREINRELLADRNRPGH